jgi:hypothetical protein
MYSYVGTYTAVCMYSYVDTYTAVCMYSYVGTYTAVCMYTSRYSRPVLFKCEFSRQKLKNARVSNFMKIREVETELFYAHGRTNRQI